MININQIQQKGNSWAPTIYVYRFPTIDFNFLNTGRATASLWQFAINVLKGNYSEGLCSCGMTGRSARVAA